MVGVGSGSALNAFNIGQAATPQTAIGQQIRSIVAQRDKIEGLNAQSGAQAAGSIATAQFKAGQEGAPIEQFQIDPITGEMRSLGKRPADSKLDSPALTEQALRLRQDTLDREEDSRLLAAKNAGVSVEPPGGNVQNVGANPNVSPFNVGGQGVPAPVAPAGTGQLKSPEFQGIDPAIFQTPEGQAALRRIIDEKMRAAGGGSV